MVESLTISNSGSTIASLYSGETLSSAATPSSVSKAESTLAGSFNDFTAAMPITCTSAESAGSSSKCDQAVSYALLISVILPVAYSTISSALLASIAILISS